MVDYAGQVKSLISEIVSTVPIFSHIRVDQILVSVSYARNSSMDGVWAEIYPMKYQNGHYSIREKKGNVITLFKTAKLHLGQREILYILYLIIPRFQNLSFHQKLKTIFHELYHISPDFNGRLREIHPRFVYHGTQEKLYERNISWWVKYYLNQKPHLMNSIFLNVTWKELKFAYPKLRFDFIPEPKEKVRKMVYRRKLGKLHKPKRDKGL